MQRLRYEKHVFPDMQEYMFRGIQKTEWEPLFKYIQERNMRIENLHEAKQGPAGGGQNTALDLGDDIDTGATSLPDTVHVETSCSNST